MGIRIDALDAAASAADDHELPAIKDGLTVKLTVAQISTKVQSDLSDDLAAKAPLASPAFTGNPTVPTPAADDDDTTIANTGWVQDEIAEAVAISTLADKSTPVDADQLRIADSAASNAAKKLTFANLWTWISGKVLTLFNASGSAPVYACRAWVNFNGTGTVAIRASGNVSSITDNGTGDYTVNFTTAMPDDAYVAICDGSLSGTNLIGHGSGVGTPKTASSCRVHFQNASNVFLDPTICDVAIFR